MKSILFFILFGFFCLLIQGSLFSSWPPARVHLEVVLLIALYLGFFGETISGLWVIIILGTMIDLLGSPFFGLMTVIYLALFLLIRLVRPYILGMESPVTAIPWMVIFIVLKQFLFIFSLRLMSHDNSFYFLLWHLVPETLWNTLWGLLFFLFFSKIVRLLNPDEEGDYGLSPRRPL